jgi:hypothetical protein
MKTKEARMKAKEEGLLATLAVLGIAALVAYCSPIILYLPLAHEPLLTRRGHWIKLWSPVEVAMPYLRVAFRERAGKTSFGGPTIR